MCTHCFRIYNTYKKYSRWLRKRKTRSYIWTKLKILKIRSHLNLVPLGPVQRWEGLRLENVAHSFLLDFHQSVLGSLKFCITLKRTSFTEICQVILKAHRWVWFFLIDTIRDRSRQKTPASISIWSGDKTRHIWKEEKSCFHLASTATDVRIKSFCVFDSKLTNGWQVQVPVWRIWTLFVNAQSSEIKLTQFLEYQLEDETYDADDAVVVVCATNSSLSPRLVLFLFN